MSVAELHRNHLEETGEYVIPVNGSKGWFAVFPKKLDACRSRARAHARLDFNLLFYRTVAGDEREHWAVPFSAVTDEFTAESLTHSAVNGSVRWNGTFRGGMLHVTHTARHVDCSRFHRVPLVIERLRSDAAFPEEVLEEETFAEGNVTRIAVNRYERDAEARSHCIALHGAVCSVCGFDFGAMYGPSMRGFIHVHHVTPLHEVRGGYVVNPKTDLVPVCPNCHAVIHSRQHPLTVEEVRRLLIKPGERSSPANGSQPSGPDSNRRSAAAGSRR